MGQSANQRIKESPNPPGSESVGGGEEVIDRIGKWESRPNRGITQGVKTGIAEPINETPTKQAMGHSAAP